MGTFFSLLIESFSCLFYGFIVTAFIMATLYFILKNISKGIVRSVPFYISGVILFFLLLINMSITIGAFAIKKQTEAMRLWLSQHLNTVDGIADIQSSQAVGNSLNEAFPMLGCFLNLFDFSGYTMNELPQAFYEVINAEMNSIIWSKILWSLAFCIAAVLVSLYFEKGETKKAEYHHTIYKDPDDF